MGPRASGNLYNLKWIIETSIREHSLKKRGGKDSVGSGYKSTQYLIVSYIAVCYAFCISLSKAISARYEYILVISIECDRSVGLVVIPSPLLACVTLVC